MAGFRPTLPSFDWTHLGKQLARKGTIPLVVLIVGIAAWQAPSAVADFFMTRPGLGLLLAFPILVWPFWTREASLRRIQSLTGQRGAKVSARKQSKGTKPPMQPYGRALAQWFDIVYFNDSVQRRIAYAVGFLASVLTLCLFPIDVAKPIPNAVIQPAIPLLFYGAMSIRLHSIGKDRRLVVEEIYNIAKEAFGYPRKGSKQANLEPKDQPLVSTACIEVFEWGTLTRPLRFWVPSSTKVSATDNRAWSELGSNLNAKVDVGDDGWHVQKAENNTGGMVAPADYPRAVLWDGEVHPDPMTFYVGRNLDAEDKNAWMEIEFSTTSPHWLVTGGTGTGKSSFAEAIIAQAAIKQMPWDSALAWVIHLLDPKDAFVKRWLARANIIGTSGVGDVENEEGDTISGIQAMAEHMRQLLDELSRRITWLKEFPTAANWKDVPHEALKAARFRPLLLVTDEFGDHVAKAAKSSIETEQENQKAREYISYATNEIARKGRSVGMHMVVVLQRGNMSILGADIPTNAGGRVVMGNIDRSQYESMFQTPDVPVLPATTRDKATGKTSPLPGRSRIQLTQGGPLYRVQVLYFGKGNIETVDKWLPRDLGPGHDDAEVIDGEVVDEVSEIEKAPPLATEIRLTAPTEPPAAAVATPPSPKAAPKPPAAPPAAAKKAPPSPPQTPPRRVNSDHEKLTADLDAVDRELRPFNDRDDTTDLSDDDERKWTALLAKRRKIMGQLHKTPPPPPASIPASAVPVDAPAPPRKAAARPVPPPPGAASVPAAPSPSTPPAPKRKTAPLPMRDASPSELFELPD